MKRLQFSLLLLAFSITLINCKNETKKQEANETEKTPVSSDSMKNNDMTVIDSLSVLLDSKSKSTAKGNVVFRQRSNTVSMTAVFTGLKEGMHAVHLHEKSDCSSDDGSSAGGHWNPMALPHGKWGDENGYHKGDIGNFSADSNGIGTVTFLTKEWCIGCGDDSKDIIGKSIIVHQGTDDFESQPSGAAGSRISCGGIIQ